VEFLRDYTGRQVDVEALQTTEEPASTIRLSKTMTDGAKHRRITGLQKLVQRYAVLFLSDRGSARHNPLQGTDFVRIAQQGGIVGRESVVYYFAFANIQVRETILKEQGDSTFGEQPEDEQFDRAVLEDYAVDTTLGYLYLKIRVYSVSGDSANFIIPIQ